MRNIMTIANRELRSYFDSPVAYIILTAFLLLAGWMFFSSFFLMGQAEMRSFFTPSPYSPSMLLVILAPALTMHLFAEERRSGTIEMMTTLPITDTEVVLGKFLASVGLLKVALALTLVYAFTVSGVGDLDWGPVISGYFGMILFVSSMLALGLLASTWTENQIVAFIFSFMLSAALYFVFWLQFFVPQSIAGVVEYLSLAFHLDNMARGVIDSRDVIYYLSLTGGALFLAVRSLERRHA